MCLFSWNLMSHQESNCPEFLKGRSAAEFSFLILPLKAVRLVSIFVVAQTNVLTDLLRTGRTQVAFHKALGNKLVCSCFIQCHRKLQSFMNAITTNSVNKIPKRHPKYFVGLFSPYNCFLKESQAYILKFASLGHYKQLEQAPVSASTGRITNQDTAPSLLRVPVSTGWLNVMSTQQSAFWLTVNSYYHGGPRVLILRRHYKEQSFVGRKHEELKQEFKF